LEENQKSEIDLLESLIATLAASCYFGDYRVIDELLDRVERYMSQRFTKEEEKMRGDRYPLLQAHADDHQLALRRFMNAHQRWKRDRDEIQLRRFLERDHCDWYAMHLHYHDNPAHRYSPVTAN
jgi:hemerythrin